MVHIPDVLATRNTPSEAQKLGGYRAVLASRCCGRDVPVGVLACQRTTVRPYTDKQIELVTTFADQAVIAIENVRLFEARPHAELPAAADGHCRVLKVISRSTFDLQTVLKPC